MIQFLPLLLAALGSAGAAGAGAGAAGAGAGAAGAAGGVGGTLGGGAGFLGALSKGAGMANNPMVGNLVQSAPSMLKPQEQPQDTHQMRYRYL